MTADTVKFGTLWYLLP